MTDNNYDQKADNIENRSENPYVERVATLPNLHNIDDAQIKAFELALGISEFSENRPLNAADLFSGNGFATCLVCKEVLKSSKSARVFLIDLFEELVNGASTNIASSLPENAGSIIQVNSLRSDLSSEALPFQNDDLDLVVIKMGIHEIAIESQIALVNELARVTKAGGRIVLWENLIAKDGNGGDIGGFNGIITIKDRLAGYEAMSQRYFLSEQEIRRLFSEAGFSVEVTYEWEREWNSLARLDTELGDDVSKLNELNAVIDSFLNTPELQEQFGYEKVVSSDGHEGRVFKVKSGIVLIKNSTSGLHKSLLAIISGNLSFQCQ